MTTKDSKVRDFIPMNPLEFDILLALSEGVRHGYEIIKEVESQGTSAYSLEPANLYRRVRRLRDAGLIANARTPASAPSDDRDRHFFRLTPLGRAVVKAEALRLNTILGKVRGGWVLPTGD